MYIALKTTQVSRCRALVATMKVVNNYSLAIVQSTNKKEVLTN